MKPSRIIHTMIPPGGWKLPLPLFDLEADSRDQLVDKLRDYHVANAMPIGGEVEELDAYFCNKFPDYCHARDDRTVAEQLQGTHTGEKLGERVADWVFKIARLSTEPIELVPGNIAAQRAEICASCRFQAGRPACCGLKVEDMTRVAAVIRRGLDVPQAEALTFCGDLGIDTRSAVFLPLTHLPDKTPSGCFIST